MTDIDNELIRKYISCQARNKLIFHRRLLSSITSIDVGRKLSEALYLTELKDRISMRAMIAIQGMMEDGMRENELLGNYLALQNIGILFEPELKIDVQQLFDAFSKNNLLFIHWEGVIENDILYFLKKENGITTSIKHLSHIVI